MKELEEIAHTVEHDVSVVSAAIDKKPLESKKFWALLVSIATISVLLLLSGMAFLHLDLMTVTHAMDSVIYIVAAYIGGQSAQDCMKAFKEK